MTPQEEEQVIMQYENELAARQAQQQSSYPYATTMFGTQQKPNLVEWQLDFKAELTDIERLLKCDIMIRDQEGNELWITNPDSNKVVFNTTGVNDIMREIRMFLNKNKVLSNYSVDEIKPRIRMIGHELRMLIYNNYEEYGIDNTYKMNNYPIVIITLLSMIEDSYRRAINGEERKDLNQARVVNQNEPLMQQMGMGNYSMAMGGKDKKRWYAPWTWSK
jgi:hypothetical protein